MLGCRHRIGQAVHQIDNPIKSLADYLLVGTAPTRGETVDAINDKSG